MAEMMSARIKPYTIDMLLVSCLLYLVGGPTGPGTRRRWILIGFLGAAGITFSIAETAAVLGTIAAAAKLSRKGKPAANTAVSISFIFILISLGGDTRQAI